MKAFFSYLVISLYLTTTVFASNTTPIMRSDTNAPKVFVMGEFDVSKLKESYNTTLFSVCKGDLDAAFDKSARILVGIEDYAQKNKFDLKGVKMWVEFYFDKDGTLKHLSYALKPNSRNIDTRDLTAFLMSFTNSFKLPISTNRRFYTNMHASFPIVGSAETPVSH
jgi:hypothetical protein